MTTDLAAMHAMELRRKLYDTYNLLRYRSRDERKAIAAGPEAIERFLARYETALNAIGEVRHGTQ